MNAHRQLFFDLSRRLGWRLPTLIALMSIVGLGEGISVALLLPLLGRLGVTATVKAGMTNNLLAAGLSLIAAATPAELLLVIVAITVAHTALYIALNWWMTRLARHYQSQRQSELFRSCVRANWKFMVGRKAGELTNAIVSESERLGFAFTALLTITSTVVVVLVYFALSMIIAWQVMLCLAVFSALCAAAMARFYVMSYAAGQLLAPLNAELQSTLSEQFAAFKLIKATGSEGSAAARVDPLLVKLERANALVSFLPYMVRALFECLGIVGFSIIIILASNGMGVAIGNVVIVLILFARLFPRITMLQAQVHFLNGHISSLEVVNRLQSAAEAAAEPRDARNEPLHVALPTSLIVQNLDVSIDGRKILDRVNVKLPIPGMLAVIGSSGAGKSTLVHALLRLIEPNGGSMQLGQYEFRSQSLSAWRGVMGYVPQETILFHSTIRENLLVANANASDAEIKIAVRRAHAQEFIDALPEGLDTGIGDQGVKLSGGQRQRLGIARALLTNPIVLLLDEAMSALDAESEAELLGTLLELRREMGIVIVAHRLAAVRAANSICVIEAGRVVEAGTWDELMARRARLYALAESDSIADSRPMAAH